MTRRGLTLSVAVLLLAVLVAAGSVLPVPYVALEPGPVSDTLGAVPGSTAPLIKISGHQTFPTQGQLDLVTVQVVGDPHHQLSLWQALRGWVDGTIAVVPQQLLFPPGETPKDVEQQNAEDMTQSQDDAITAALTYLHIPVTTRVVVSGLTKDAPAAKVLQSGDVLLAVDGTAVTGAAQLRTLITRHQPGDTLQLRIRRSDRTITVSVRTIASSEGGARHAIVGFVPQERHDFPFKVTINLADVGGPSAGMAFALGIVDKLTPGSLTGGRHIAGTGTIDPSGKVGEVGGVQQKVVGAARAGATVFLVPKGECADARSTAPKGIRLVSVQTLSGAVTALEHLASGRGAVPSC